MNTSAEIVEVETVTVQKTTAPNVLELDGTLAPKRRARLSPLVNGHVSDVRVERGDVVREGAPLVVLRATDFRLVARAASARAEAQLDQLGVDTARDFDPDAVADVTAARSDWEAKRDQLQRLTPLHASGVVDDRTYEQTRIEETAAHARYDQARQRARGSLATYTALASEASLRRNDASNTTVRAPFAGAVVDRLVEVGEFVSTQTPVVELVDATELRLELAAPERYATLIRVGQPVSITIDGTDETLEGVVRFVAASLDTTNRSLMIEVVADNHDLRIRAGHFARGRLTLDGTHDIMRVPASAVAERAGVFRVFTVERGIATTRVVRVISSTPDTVTLEADLPDGAAVVTRPPRTLADGVHVRARASR
jgi:RND family efflux transporter MFP subunit